MSFFILLSLSLLLSLSRPVVELNPLLVGLLPLLRIAEQPFTNRATAATVATILAAFPFLEAFLKPAILSLAKFANQLHALVTLPFFSSTSSKSFS